MEIDIYVRTGEVRRVRDQENFINDDGDWETWRGGQSKNEYVVGIRNKIEISDVACSFSIYENYGKPIGKFVTVIPIPHSKPKVKVWQWKTINKYSTLQGISLSGALTPMLETMEEVEEWQR